MNAYLGLGASHADPYFRLEDDPSPFITIVCRNYDCDEFETVFWLSIGTTNCPTCGQRGEEI